MAKKAAIIVKIKFVSENIMPFEGATTAASCPKEIFNIENTVKRHTSFILIYFFIYILFIIKR